MANDNIIHHFTATDIAKYHRGQLSSKQMHDLEKAALDDPFLADALEGYSLAGVNAAADIAQLKERLGEKLEGAKVISMQTAPRNSFKILRAAIMVLFVVGAGILIYQLGFNNNKNEVAQVQPVKKEEAKTDTVKKNIEPVGNSSSPASEIAGDGKQVPAKNEQPATTKALDQETDLTKVPGQKGAGETPVVTGNIKSDDGAITRSATTPDAKTVVNAPVKAADENKERLKNAEKSAEKYKKDEVAREDFYNDKAKSQSEEVAAGVKDKLTQQNSRNQGVVRKEGYINNNNTFRGRVVDADNNGVPFANVTNVQDNNAGTYTDARGNFNLTYPDSVLTVQVRSIGFENTNVQLRNAVPTNQVVMQDDRSLSGITVDSRQRNLNTDRKRDANMKLEEPEPVDGWVYYDAYLANNLEVPEDLKNKPSSAASEVQVSFEVDKNGEPTNIRVEKSLCSKCDKEAIRLVKEGPKFKRNANKKGRTTVTVTF